MSGTFKTKSGLTLNIRSVPSAKIGLIQSKVRNELKARGLAVDPPEVTLKSADGREWTMPLQYDAATGKGNLVDSSDEAETARRLALWRAHEDALAQVQTETWEQAMKVYLSLGLVFTMPTEDSDEWSDWVEELEYLGQEVPGTRLEAKALYITTRVLEDDEIAKVLPQVMAASQGDMVTEAEKEAYFRGFYGSMARAAQSRFAAAGTALGQVADVPESDRVTDGEGVGDQEPEPVGQAE